jgi:phosphatidylserine/phosphatidylglycerophosphate/cardiolipin synthase-like enzyme
VEAVVKLNRRLRGTKKKVRVWILISTVSMLDYGRHSWQTRWKKANFYTDLRELPPPTFAFPEARLLPNVDLRIKTFHKFVFGAMHSKMGIIDGKHVVAGGKNLDALTGHEYMFRVDGSAQQPMRSDFEEIWSEPLPKLRSAINRPLKGDVPMIYVGRTEDPTFFAMNEDNPQNLAWIGAFKVAKKEVFVESPNFVTQRITDLAVEAVKRGIKVTIITSLYMSDEGQMVYMNSYKTSPLMAKHVYDRLKGDPAATKRMTICWFIGKTKAPKPSKAEWTHVKAMTVDDEFAIIGSGNMDPQSWYHSREDNYLIDDPGVAKAVKANILKNEQSLRHCFHGPK